ncbi:short-chain dehydrogenase/reductase family 16C member 6-like [Temnothorax curvispinosus]|uniref:Short-chain dehydrogenase/reductase 3 n=1 Tax=Temnothorax curvispinosus TaxID=300111 RepID=A0A6J1Q7J3_9HYME|nr:short-chain dehydrogenase/reductase family 16C member 6-like [Temnothorax curvispinosus]XP_024878206.1 short-chain dehydrogenase/reductase family 16C member 6-like [Temnothorax curvispinosus]XP_024878207.1 short-chain dehydrogenase/reductase family 16C member 6-like [Temnothorax curvispinosus]XP_024878208.1 short-chain dehydrogenase/reductase family 16C member 6-like [Temnothorax curvispinosus]
MNTMNSNDDQTIMMKTYNMLLLLAEILFLILKVVYYICEDVYRLIVPTKKKSVAGEIVLITGAGHGIGKELAIGYASLGATVICWDINEETNNETMNDIKRMGRDSVYAYRCNVADREEVFRVAEKVKKEIGDVTILVNNAGIGIFKSFLNHSLDEIERVMNVNATAHFWTLKAFLPSMIEKNHGHIVALSSVAGLMCTPYATVYCPSKFAVKAIMEAVSEELRAFSNEKSDIKFTTIYPGLVHTGMVKKTKVRFPRMMNGHSPREAASLIIDAQRRNYENRTLPSYWLPLLNIKRTLPGKARKCILDFLDSGVYPDD